MKGRVEESSLGKKYDRRMVRRMLAYLWPYRRQVAASVALLLGHSMLEIAGPLLTKVAVDRYLAPSGTSSLPWLDARLPTGALDGLALLALIYLAAITGSLIFEFGQQYLMNLTGQRAMFDVRGQLMAHLQRLDLAYYDRTPVGRTITRVTTDVDALNELFASGLVTMLADIAVLSLVLLTMARLSPQLTLLMLALTPAVITITIVFRRTVQAANRQIRVAVAKINAYLQEHLNGITVLQLFNREARSQADFAEINAAHRDAYYSAINAYGWFYPAVEFCSMLGLASLLSYGGYRVRDNTLSLGVLIAFFQYGLRLFRPIQDLSEKYNILQAALAAAERIFQLLDEPVRIAAPENKQPASADSQAIEFDHVWFAYQNEDWVLRDVSFRIEPGETIAVAGHTGAGKTTLISLLLRFYDIQRGVIRIGGVDIAQMDPRDLRANFGVVLQDPHLFTGTVGGNIRMGTERITDEEVEESAGLVNLMDFVKNWPEGFDRPVRERGAGLSTGQKQLISFARALAHNPRFLILDEATSSVDTETEIKVREALARMVENRTSIIIAHRLSTIQRADRILVMHKGKLREQGAHQELLAARGIYWKLYQLQYREQEAPR
jgi:ATP-binding cassette, subfamily B, multidrug efflux pump